MASVSVSVSAAATPEKVWSVLADPSRFSSWVDNHQGFIGEPPTAFAPGSAFGQRLRVMGMPADVTWTVESSEEPERLTLKGNGPMGIGLLATYAVEAAGAGSTVTTSLEFSGAAVMAVGAQIEREVGASLETSLGKLKALVEA